MPKISDVTVLKKINTSFLKMDRPKIYKKHMKHATDLFWISKDQSDQAAHWHFDETYSVTQCEEFSCKMTDDMIRKTFESCDENVRGCELTMNSVFNSGIDAIEKPTYCRQFLTFPNGFWSDLQATESQVPVIRPIRDW
jgi:hypothetical protein